jgi:LysM repeat protein
MKINWGISTDMTPFTRYITICVLITHIAIPAWGGEYFLYTPHQVPPSEKASSQDGILVQEIEVQKGDTLYGLSHKFSGRGMYFPQILLFNSIKNPNLIYTGDILKVPVKENSAEFAEHIETHKPSRPGKRMNKVKTKALHSARISGVISPAIELSASDLRALGSAKKSSRHIKKVQEVKSSSNVSPLPPSAVLHPTATRKTEVEAVVTPSVPATTAGQQLFESAVKAYRKDDCRTALELLDRYLADYSKSPLAADASLYRAECFLKLSAQ